MVLLSSLTELPVFLRFSTVNIHTDGGTLSIEEKCNYIDSCLQSLQFIDAGSITFFGDIDNKTYLAFDNLDSFLHYLKEKLIPFFNSCQSFSFNIWYNCENISSKLIGSILQMVDCKNISFDITPPLYTNNAIVPAKNISDWLNQNQKERFLQISTYRGINNAHECYTTLKDVIFFLLNNIVLTK